MLRQLFAENDKKRMRQPGFEPGLSRPQREVLTSILLPLAHERRAPIALLKNTAQAMQCIFYPNSPSIVLYCDGERVRMLIAVAAPITRFRIND